MGKRNEMFDRDDAMKVAATEDLAKHIATKAHDNGITRSSSQALLRLVVRTAGSAKSISILIASCGSEDEYEAVALDCGAIFRCMFDAYIQAAYIMHDPETREDRSKDYLDYIHIERFRMSISAMDQENDLSRKISSSPLREEGERRVRQEYERVKSKFPGRGLDGVRNHWYPKNLWHISSNAGKQEEFVWFVTMFNSCVHTGPYAMLNGPPVPRAYFIDYSIVVFANIAELLVQNEALKLDNHMQMQLDEFAGSLLNVGGSE